MTRDQHLQFCKRCTNRKFDATQGVICSITNRIANFEKTCENFTVDETVKIEAPPVEVVPNFKVVTALSDDAKELLRNQQDTGFAIVGGTAAAIVGAVLWAMITVATKYQIGYMAIGVGLLVGFAVRYFGAGVDTYFGYIGAFFALLGCALGNLFSQVGFTAHAESLTYFETLTLLTPEVIVTIYADSFSPIDILFYGIAAFEGYKFAFRNISDELVSSVAAGKLAPPPFAHLRFPTVGVLLVLLTVGGYIISKGTMGVRTYYYESGSKRTSGELVNGKENGPWQGWWENGNLQYQGFYREGKQDSAWLLYDENGKLYRKLSFKNNLQHGLTTDYFANGQISGVANYVTGRLQGASTYFYENGNIRQKGFYYLDMPDGLWEIYHENGKLNSKGYYKKNVLFGDWTTWNSNGQMIEQITYADEGNFKIMNTWNDKGVAEVVNGNGRCRIVFADQSVETGMVKNGEKTGTWKKMYANGKLQEEGEYRNDSYYLTNAFDQEGKQLVKEGEGWYENTSADGSVLSGVVEKGLKTEKWRLHSATSIVLQELTYLNGKLEGPSVNYYESGAKYSEGNLKNNKQEGVWTWYFENGEVESLVTMVNGNKEGEQLFYDESGLLLRTEVYKNGELIQTKLPE